MKLKIASAVLLTAVAAGVFADELPSVPTEPVVSTKSRAEVQAELLAYQKAGVNPWSTSYNQLANFKSSTSRQEVVAEYLAVARRSGRPQWRGQRLCLPVPDLRATHAQCRPDIGGPSRQRAISLRPGSAAARARFRLGPDGAAARLGLGRASGVFDRRRRGARVAGRRPGAKTRSAAPCSLPSRRYFAGASPAWRSAWGSGVLSRQSCGPLQAKPTCRDVFIHCCQPWDISSMVLRCICQKRFGSGNAGQAGAGSWLIVSIGATAASLASGLAPARLSRSMPSLMFWDDDNVISRARMPKSVQSIIGLNRLGVSISLAIGVLPLKKHREWKVCCPKRLPGRAQAFLVALGALACEARIALQTLSRSDKVISRLRLPRRRSGLRCPRLNVRDVGWGCLSRSHDVRTARANDGGHGWLASQPGPRSADSPERQHEDRGHAHAGGEQKTGDQQEQPKNESHEGGHGGSMVLRN